MSAKFYICDYCKNLVEIINDAGVPLVCCGKKMTELVPNTVEASNEKHLPVVEIVDNVLTVKVGAVEHPMLQEHHISFIYVETSNGGMRKDLAVGSKPIASFSLGDEKPIAVYAYCNLHRLWKTEL